MKTIIEKTIKELIPNLEYFDWNGGTFIKSDKAEEQTEILRETVKALIEIQEFLPELSSLPKTETKMGNIVKKTINAIEKATEKSWEEIRNLIDKKEDI